MRVVEAIGLLVLFAIGAAIGFVLGLVIAPISFLRGGRAVHLEGVLCRAELAASSEDANAARLAGPALVRLSGAIASQASSAHDVLGLLLRLQRTASDDPRTGDQDLVFGTFESFATVARDRDRTRSDDYLANAYASVTPWWLPGHGAVMLRLTPLAAPAPSTAARLARLTDAVTERRAGFALTAHRSAHFVAPGDARAAPDAIVLGELYLRSLASLDGNQLRASMFRAGRGIRPLGLRNGIRALVYPMSQLARRLRGR